MEEVFRSSREHRRLREVLLDAVAALPDERRAPCAHALDGIKLPFDLP
jgi:5'-methylthioadenosine phosphorylase